MLILIARDFITAVMCMGFHVFISAIIVKIVAKYLPIISLPLKKYDESHHKRYLMAQMIIISFIFLSSVFFIAMFLLVPLSNFIDF